MFDLGDGGMSGVDSNKKVKFYVDHFVIHKQSQLGDLLSRLVVVRIVADHANPQYFGYCLIDIRERVAFNSTLILIRTNSYTWRVMRIFSPE